MNIETFTDTDEIITENGKTLTVNIENPLDKIDKGKKPLFLVHTAPITDQSIRNSVATIKCPRTHCVDVIPY